MRDNFNMENARRSSDYEAKKFFLKLSRFGFLLLLATFICSLIAVALLVYNFAVCPQEEQMQHCRSRFEPTSDGPPSFSSENESESAPILKDVRLPRAIKPISYDIVIVPYLSRENFTFDGDVIIKIEVDKSCKNITLHSAMLKIHRNLTSVYKINENGNQSLTIRNQFFVDAKQFLVIETEEELEKGKNYFLKISYAGLIRDNLQGFYKSSYKVNNETKWLASTQFQATDARRAFPCFDEPEYKATFKLTLGRPKSMMTLSNMPLDKTVPSVNRAPAVENYFFDLYPESIKMSTYLVAFVVSDFVNISNTKENFSVWARPDAIQSTDYALNIGPKIINFLNDFFDIKYPLPKMDLIAVPDFLFGAMENYGLITFRETAMLYDSGVSPVSKKMTVASVVGHECAHQWFGNLITPHWWSDLWLNEGFATYMEHIIVDHIEPTWQSKDLFVINELHPVFSFDALASSHKISIEVQNPEQINEIFDFISYSKGASLIRSMENFLTLEVFKRGLSKYVKKFAYKTATQDDLWNELTMEAHSSDSLEKEVSVKQIMDTWTLQTGLPYILVTRNYENNKINIEQKRFLLLEANSSLNLEKDEKDPLWWIPITYTTSNELNFNDTKPSHWMKATRSITIDDSVDDASWIIFNTQVAHYYRVNYDLQNWKLITQFLNDPQNFDKIAVVNRAQLIDDAMNLARADFLDYTVALDVTKYLKHENEYVPWKTAISNLLYIDQMLIRSPDYHLMKRYFTTRIEEMYDKVGFEDQGDVLTMLTRNEILRAACHLGYKKCVLKAQQQYFNWMNEANPDINNPISPNLKIIVYCTSIKHGGQEEWDFAWERYLNTSMSSEKELLLGALGCTREHWLINRFLNLSLSNDGGIRKQDTFRVFSSVSSSVYGQPVAFNFLRENWKQLRQHFGIGSPMSTINSLIKFVSRRMTDRNQLEALKKFDDKDLREGRTLKQAIEVAEANIAWLNKNQEKIFNWLKENSD